MAGVAGDKMQWQNVVRLYLLLEKLTFPVTGVYT